MVCCDFIIFSRVLDFFIPSRVAGVSMSAIFNYLESQSFDHRHRSADYVLSQPNQFWDDEHDFIQWLLPLSEKSMSVPNSPVLRGAEADRIRQSSSAQLTIKAAADRLLSFLNETQAWRSRFNHNHLRITRAIRSLRLLVSDADADLFRASVIEMLGDDFALINDKSRIYWFES
jgi:hypothetical protein